MMDCGVVGLFLCFRVMDGMALLVCLFRCVFLFL